MEKCLFLPMADRQHARLVAALDQQPVKGRGDVAGEILGMDKAAAGRKAHVVGVEGIRQDDVIGVLQKARHVIVIGIRDPVEAPGLRRQPHRIDRAAPGIPALRRRAHDFGMQPERRGDLGALLGLGHVFVLDPFQPVGGDLPARGLHARHLLRVARERGGDAVDGERDAHFGEQPVQPPEPGARAVFIDRFHVPVPLAGPHPRAVDIGQEGLGGGIAMQDVVLAALFVIDDELNGDARAIRPLRLSSRRELPRRCNSPGRLSYLRDR